MRPFWLTSPKEMSPLLGMAMELSARYVATMSASAMSTRPLLSTSPSSPPAATFDRGALTSASATRSTGPPSASTRKAGSTWVTSPQPETVNP